MIPAPFFSTTSMHVGISAYATYVPSRVQSSEYLAEATGIPRNVLEEKFGILSKPWAAEGEQVSAMAVNAAKAALNGCDPKTIDVVIWTGSEHKAYPLWSAGPKVQHEIGALNEWSTDVASRRASPQAAVEFTEDMIIADTRIKKVRRADRDRMI